MVIRDNWSVECTWRSTHPLSVRRASGDCDALMMQTRHEYTSKTHQADRARNRIGISSIVMYASNPGSVQRVAEARLFSSERSLAQSPQASCISKWQCRSRSARFKMSASLRPSLPASRAVMASVWAYVALLALGMPGTAADAANMTECTTVLSADDINAAVVPGGTASVCISSDVGSECASNRLHHSVGLARGLNAAILLQLS